MMETVYPAMCGSFKHHSEHSWRDGFLWLRKATCLGSARTLPKDWVPPSAALIPMKIILPPHKHMYRLQKRYTFGLKRPEDLLWYCECGHYFVINREIWQDYPSGVHYDIK